MTSPAPSAPSRTTEFDELLSVQHDIAIRYRRFVKTAREQRRLRFPASPPLPEPAPLVSVIVVNFNGEAILGECLDAVLRLRYPALEIIVVDNGSRDQSRPLLAERARNTPHLRTVFLAENRGCAGGRNAGVDAARGEILAFIDNDGYPEQEWLDEAVRALLSEPKRGAVASAVFLRRCPQLLNGIGGTINLHAHGGDLNYAAPYEWTGPAPAALFPMGCGMVVRRTAWQCIAPLDETLPKWYDDVELGMALWQAGWDVATAPRACVEHDLHTSDLPAAQRQSITDRLKRPLGFETARIRTALKFFPLARLPALLLWDAVGPFRDFELRPALVRAIAWLRNVGSLRSIWGIRCGRPRHAASAMWAMVAQHHVPVPPPGPPVRCSTEASRFRALPSTVDCRSLPALPACFEYGWYERVLRLQAVNRTGFLMGRVASALFRLDSPALHFSIALQTPGASDPVTVLIRSIDSPHVFISSAEIPAGSTQATLDASFQAGVYEVIVRCAEDAPPPSPLAVVWLGFHDNGFCVPQ